MCPTAADRGKEAARRALIQGANILAVVLDPPLFAGVTNTTLILQRLFQVGHSDGNTPNRLRDDAVGFVKRARLPPLAVRLPTGPSRAPGASAPYR
jgi:hypothetical protein